MEAIEKGNMGYSHWYEMWKPRRLEWMTSKKLLTQVLAKRTSLAVDDEGELFFVGGGTAGGNAVIIEGEERYYQALLNSSITSFYLMKIAIPYNNDYYSFGKGILKDLPIIERDYTDNPENLSEKAEKISKKKNQLSSINLNIRDYLTTSLDDPDGKTLGEMYMPVEGLSETILTDTKEDRDNINIGSVELEEQSNSLILNVSVKYKPEDDEGFDDE